MTLDLAKTNGSSPPSILTQNGRQEQHRHLLRCSPTTHPIPDSFTASPTPVPNRIVPPDDNPSEMADYVAIVEDLPEILNAMHRGASAAVKARRLPYIRVGVRSLRRRPDNPNDYTRFIEDVTLASSLIDDAVAAAIDELYRSSDEFLKKSLEDQKQDARKRAMKHAWKLLDARKRSKEVRLEPPSDDNSASENDCPLTNMADDVTLKVTEYDPVLIKTTCHSASHPSWQAVNDCEDRLIEMIDRRRAGLAGCGKRDTAT